MKKLAPKMFDRARSYLHTSARPLEKAMFALEIEGGTVDEFLTALENYQNPDGGFGRALEPDAGTPSSSALCTEIGLRYLAAQHVPADHPMVSAAVDYLLKSFEPERRVWRVIPSDANQHPHAPWWHDENGSLERSFDGYMVIPRAGILASLHHYAELLPENWLDPVTEDTVRDIENLDIERFGGGGDTLVYALRLAEAPGLADRFKSRLRTLLRDVADAVVTRDPQAWSGYATPALKLAPTPDSLLADMLANDLQVYLDYLVDQQTSEGFWEPTWNWGQMYPADWIKAREAWRGILTLDNLSALRKFGRLAS